MAVDHQPERITAIGAGWKAHFRSEAVEFVPALGRSAPAHSLSFALRSVGREQGPALDLLTRVEPTHDAAAQRVTYAHAPGLEARWELEPSGLEQTYWLAERPAGAGALVLRGTLATELPRPLEGAHADGLRFEDPALGGVRLSAVFGVDARGRRCAGRFELVGAELALVLPEAFVDSASYPLLVDPIWTSSNQLTAGSLTHLERPRLAYDELNARHMVAYEAHWNASDSDVYVGIVAASGAALSAFYVVDSGPRYATRPEIAGTAGASRCVVAYASALDSQSAPELRARTVGFSGGVGPIKTFESAGSGWQNHDLEVSHIDDGQPGATSATLAITRSNGKCEGRTLSVAASDGSLSEIGSHTFFEAANLSSAGELSVCVLDWSPGQRDALVQEHDGGTRLWLVHEAAGSKPNLVYEVPQFDLDLQVDAQRQGSWVLATWALNVFASSADLQLQLLRGTPGAGTPPLSIAMDPGTPGLDAVHAPRLARVADEVVLAYGRSSGLGAGDAHALIYRSYLPGGSGPWPLAEPEQSWPLALPLNEFDLSALPGADAGVGAWDVAALDGSDPAHAVHVGAFSASGPGGGAIDLGGGSGSGGVLEAVGAVALGNDAFQLRAKSLPNWLSLSLFNFEASGSTLQCGSCVFQPLDLVFLAVPQAGEVTLDLPIPHEPNLVGAQVNAQLASIYTLFPTDCALFSDVAFSNRLRLTVGM